MPTGSPGCACANEKSRPQLLLASRAGATSTYGANFRDNGAPSLSTKLCAGPGRAAVALQAAQRSRTVCVQGNQREMDQNRAFRTPDAGAGNRQSPKKARTRPSTAAQGCRGIHREGLSAFNPSENRPSRANTRTRVAQGLLQSAGTYCLRVCSQNESEPATESREAAHSSCRQALCASALQASGDAVAAGRNCRQAPPLCCVRPNPIRSPTIADTRARVLCLCCQYRPQRAWLRSPRVRRPRPGRCLPSQSPVCQTRDLLAIALPLPGAWS
ncbi:hypothetical protein SAMN05421548_12948 [Paraburkholderia lycopersici]|uniref:Uncharacterized protein n=1 Tax=Paraburkholderia lycopersici TaxID=416944 RepID=A0A1G6Z1J5_9BURK|nr:hypothetical protein SAMN05421548_12948 [Paraburkholderia lycopersici]